VTDPRTFVVRLSVPRHPAVICGRPLFKLYCPTGYESVATYSLALGTVPAINCRLFGVPEFTEGAACVQYEH
jgi:hypothetical protein